MLADGGKGGAAGKGSCIGTGAAPLPRDNPAEKSGASKLGMTSWPTLSLLAGPMLAAVSASEVRSIWLLGEDEGESTGNSDCSAKTSQSKVQTQHNMKQPTHPTE